MIEMTFELAEKIAKATHKKSGELNRPMSVSIVDESGRMVYFSRADEAGFYTFDTSKAKAMAAASFKRSTMEIDSIKNQNPLLWFSTPERNSWERTPKPRGGGVPL